MTTAKTNMIFTKVLSAWKSSVRADLKKHAPEIIICVKNKMLPLTDEVESYNHHNSATSVIKGFMILLLVIIINNNNGKTKIAMIVIVVGMVKNLISKSLMKIVI